MTLFVTLKVVYNNVTSTLRLKYLEFSHSSDETEVSGRHTEIRSMK